MEVCQQRKKIREREAYIVLPGLAKDTSLRKWYKHYNITIIIMIKIETSAYIILPGLAEDPEVCQHLYPALWLDGTVASTRTLVHLEVG